MSGASAKSGRPWLAIPVGSFVGKFGLVLALLVLTVAFSVALPQSFPTVGNAVTIITSQSVLLFLALAATMPLISGDFDLSIAQTMTFTAVLLAVLTSHLHVAIWLAILIALLVAIAIGVVNGVLIVTLKLNAFVTTLGMMTLLTGLGYALTNYSVVFGMPGGVLALSRNQILGLPQIVYFGWALLLVMWYLYEFTPYGRHLRFTGENARRARLAGVRIGALRFSAFVAAAAISGLAGVMFAGQTGAVDPTVGPQYLLPPYAAAFLGTTTIQIGRFNAWGTLVALYVLAVGVTGLELFGAPTWVAEVFDGAALIAAIAFARAVGSRYEPEEVQ